MIDEFNATHENIHVTMDIQPWDSIAQKLPTAIASGSGPDLATPDYNVATVLEYVANDLALPLDAVVGNGDGQVSAEAIPPTLLESFTVDSKIYAMPANFSTLMLYYNVDLLNKAGLTEPPTTMAELQSASVTFAEETGDYGIAVGDHETTAVWPILIWADGGDIVNAEGCSALGDTATIDSVTRWADLIRNSKISAIGLSGQDADNLFAAGKALFEINGPWAASAYEEAGVNFELAAVPVGASGAPVTLAQTVPTIVSAKTEHPEEAQQFLAWWMSKSAQAQLAIDANYPPSRTDMADDSELAKNPLVARFAEQAPYARLYLPQERDFNKIDTDIFMPAIQSATQNGDATQALTSADSKLKELVGC
jgi:ABC-type glycerol-3-phosphate transport system substrate-binding protein